MNYSPAVPHPSPLAPRPSSLVSWLAIAVCFLAAGCRSRSGPEVIVYCALDAQFSEPILNDFAGQSGIAVRPKFDAESTKTIGLVEAILAEGNRRTRCDVFWNNEILHTLRLEKAGLLDVYAPPAAKDFPDWARSPEARWHGFAARARILVVNAHLVPPAERPASILDLADPKWRGRCGIAKPLFGTTATHAACLFAAWGDRRAKDFFRRLNSNEVKILSGNRQVAEAVAAGRIAFGLTDTDDAVVELESGMRVAIVFPDQQEGGLGTLLIPNTLAIVRGGPNPAAARKLVDHLLSPQVEARLAAGPSAQIPLSPTLQAPERLGVPKPLRTMQVDFRAAADRWDEAARFLRDEFARAN